VLLTAEDLPILRGIGLLLLPGFAGVGGGEAAAILGADYGGLGVVGFDGNPVGGLGILFGWLGRGHDLPIEAVG